MKSFRPKFGCPSAIERDKKIFGKQKGEYVKKEKKNNATHAATTNRRSEYHVEKKNGRSKIAQKEEILDM